MGCVAVPRMSGEVSRRVVTILAFDVFWGACMSDANWGQVFRADLHEGVIVSKRQRKGP